ncbi:MAG: hypothetical protein ACK4K7_09030 [Allosphingosinicella sp.]|uniref:hypothetical protein n=1 Tax=Allosphingosinicella sp. TaxID=2823234 RepID=UPI0039412909
MARLPRMSPEGFWRALLFLGTAVTLVIYLVRAFQPLAIQDDARQFMLWMPRLRDPEAMRGDLLADYWQSVSPPVYRLPFEFFALFGVDPLIVGKLLPVLLIGVSAWAAWRIAMTLTGRPLAAFVAAAFVMALVIHEDSVYTASPRAFSPPLFLLFVDALLRDRMKTMLGSIFLLASIYPTTALVALAMLGLSRIERVPRLRIDLSRRSILLVGGGTLAILVAIVPFPTQTSRWEPTLTIEQALTMPNLATPGGRSSLVREDGGIGWICSARMGFVPEMVPCGRGIPFAELTNILLLLPLLWLIGDALRRPVMPGGGRNPNALYAWALLAALFWYAVAVAFAFKLHLPSRYSQRVLSILEWLAIGQLIGLWLDRQVRERGLRAPAVAAGGAIALLVAVSFLTPTPGLRRPADPGAMRHIAAAPPDTLVAGVSEDLDFVPALTGRAALATTEHAIPYHIGYYRHVDARLSDSLRAAATPDADRMRTILRVHGPHLFAVDRSLLEEGAVPPRYATIVAAASAEAEAMLAAGPSAMQRLAAVCAAYRGPSLILLDVKCLVGSD